jgi:hypothetical protein
MTTVNLGWATTDAATSPTTTPSALQNIQAYTVKLTPERPAKPYQFIDGSTVERGGGLIYTIEFDLTSLAFVLSSTGVGNTHQLHLWWQNSPKFMQSNTSNWINIFGSDWVKVTGEGKMSFDKQYGREYYKLTVKAAAPKVLS